MLATRLKLDRKMIRAYSLPAVTSYPIKTINRDNPRYPKLLAQISDPPEILYCRGNLDLLNTPCLGVVGTRKITPYGKEAAQYLARQLASNGFTIVSGLALGIDAVAHQATLDARGKTIAVFGTGPEDAMISPKTNFRLAQDILKNDGLLVSEYPAGTPGADWTFPMRNRIISGLSKGVIIIEADKSSGALITAKSALDQNRDVFAVPGGIFSPRSIGPNMLIQQGAKLVLNPSDILSEYTLPTALYPLPSRHVSTQDPVQKKILDILESNGPTYIDTIISQTEMETQKVMAALSMLEITEKIKHAGNGIYKTSL